MSKFIRAEDIILVLMETGKTSTLSFDTFLNFNTFLNIELRKRHMQDMYSVSYPTWGAFQLTWLYNTHVFGLEDEKIFVQIGASINELLKTANIDYTIRAIAKRYWRQMERNMIEGDLVR